MNYECNIDDILNQWSKYWMNNLILFDFFKKMVDHVWSENSILDDFLWNKYGASAGWNGDLSLKNAF